MPLSSSLPVCHGALLSGNAAPAHTYPWASGGLPSVLGPHPERLPVAHDAPAEGSTTMTHAPRLESWNRRTFLKGMGLGFLTFDGLSCLTQGVPVGWAAAPPSRFVYAWTAFDLLDPHVKYDGNAYFFNLNMYDNLLRYQGNPPEIVP